MANRTVTLTENLYQYLLDYGVKESPVMQELREVTHKMPTAMMQIAPEQGQFMHFLTKLLGVKKALEIGTFTGYSSLAVATALPEDGKLIACDINGEWTNIAKEFWQKAGVDHKIDLRLAPALETLDQLIKEQATFDLIFLDADKINYMNYYERSMQLLNPCGVLLIDNVFATGLVANPDDEVPRPNRAMVHSVHALNERLKNEPDIDLCILPIGDGLTMVRKK